MRATNKEKVTGEPTTPPLKTPQNEHTTLFVVTHVTISASEPDANGFVDARLFKTKKRALNQLKTWRDEEMEYRKNTGAAYVVYTDTDQKFHCTWDSDNEGVIISIKETEVG